MNAAAVSTFTRQMADLLSGGLPLTRCLEVARRNARGQRAKAAVRAILDDINAGTSLAEALAAHAAVFPPVYVGLVRAGESSGALAEAFDKLAAHLEAENELKRKLRNAAIYPAVILALSLSVCLFLTTFVVPRFEFLFDEIGQRLPAPTRLLLAVSGGLRRFGLLALLVVAAAAFLSRSRFISLVRRGAAKLTATAWGRRLVEAPAVASWAGTLAALLGAGFMVSEALAITRRSMSGRWLASGLKDVEARVAQGDDLSAALRVVPHMPVVAVELIAAGEEAGRLPEALDRIARAFEREADANLRAALAVLEPALIVAMAAVVAFVAVAMLLPIFEMSASMR